MRSPSSPLPPIIRTLRNVLRPLIRVALEHGVTYPQFAELLKKLFVEVADEHFSLSAQRQTDSRVSLLTGVHRKDVKRLRHEHGDLDEEAVPASVSLGAQIVAAWTANPHYVDAEGRALPLPRLASRGGEDSFEALVTSVSKDIRSRAVLDEWLRLGIAHVDEEDRVCLNSEAFVPEEGYEEKAFYFAHNVHDHIAAAAHNLLGAKPPFLERSVYYDELTAESVAELARQAERSGMQALKAVNKEAIARETADAASEEPRRRFTFGIYFYSAPGRRKPDDK